MNKKYKVYRIGKDKPQIKIQNRLLKICGFDIGVEYKITYDLNKLVLEIENKNDTVRDLFYQHLN